MNSRIDVRPQRASKIAARLVMSTPLPIVTWAGMGAAFLVFQLYVLGTWIVGSNFKPTSPGRDPSA